MSKFTLCVMMCIWLFGCGPKNVQPSPPKIEVVKVPVHVSCIGKLPIKPDLLSDAEFYALRTKPSSFVTALHIDRLKRDAYMAELEAVIEGCK